MATIGHDHNGHKRILFQFNGARRTVRLGKCTEKQAQTVCNKIEAMVAAKITGQQDDEVSRWLAGLPDELHSRIAKTGLLPPRVHLRQTLGVFLQRYIENQSDRKPNTIANYHQGRKWLERFFGKDRPMNDMTPVWAGEFVGFMVEHGLAAKSSARRKVGLARQFFKAAIQQGVYQGENPFAGISANVRADKSRQAFIPPETIHKVIEACPDAEWRLLVALARYGGLRINTEPPTLRWAEVDWQKGTMVVHSPKTEHIEGHESRIVPIFAELQPYLQDAFELAEPGVEFVITRHREGDANLRTTFKKIIRRAGVQPWPKLWHNLRASRQTELSRIHPEHVVCAWLGNSQKVARENYLQVTPQDIERAVRGPSTEGEPTPLKAAQNPAQQGAANGGTGRQTARTTDEKTPILQGISDVCTPMHNSQLRPAGVEPATFGFVVRRSIQLSYERDFRHWAANLLLS